MNCLIVLLLASTSLCASAASLPRAGKPLEDGPDYPIQAKSLDIGGLGPIISLVKYQFREIIEEICQQALRFIVDEFHIYKVNVLRKLGKYTLSDIFHTMFDGVAGFVTDTSLDEDVSSDSDSFAEDEAASETSSVTPAPAEPDLSYLPFEWREALSPEIRSKRT